MKIQILIENTTKSDLIPEHGLSFFIEYNDKKILLDAGITSAFINNAKNMGVDIASADYCVLSHGHYDHSGGFAEYLKQNPTKKVYAMKTITDDYYSASGGNIHPIGVPKDVFPAYKANFVLLNNITKLSEGVYVIPHKNTSDLSKIGERAKLYKKIKDEYVPDDFSHELSLVFDTDGGLVIFNSCSHSGITNIINEVKDYFGTDKNIRAFFGGLHMKGKLEDREICTFSESEIRKTVNHLKDNKVDKLYTGHCTGIVGYELIKKYMGDKVEYIHTGKEIVL
ncbi:MAG: MBL fold metallo-hydrolase [Lachnospiraceae bacterium]|nr:MBL fold metallo-hydrolase [Lachnospiraceae bacterium]